MLYGESPHSTAAAAAVTIIRILQRFLAPEMLMISLNVLAYFWTILATALSGYIILKYGLNTKDVAQRNAQFRSLQRHFLTPYLSILLAESIQGPYLYVLYYAYGFLPAQIAVLYVVGLIMNVICTIFTVHLLSKYGRKVLCLCCVGTGSLACLLKFSDNYLILLIGRLLDGFSAALIITPFQQWYGHEHVLSFDFPKEWMASSVAVLSTSAGFLSVLAGLIAEFAESISSITAFPFFFSIVFQLAGGLYIMRIWPENRLEPEHRVSMKQQFTRSLSIFKVQKLVFSFSFEFEVEFLLQRKPAVLVLCVIHTLFESTMLIFIFVWTPLFIHTRTLFIERLSYGGIYASFMAFALLGSVTFRRFHKFISPTQALLGSSFIALNSLGLTVMIIPAKVTYWNLSLYQRLLILCCLFEFAVGVYLPAMSKLQAELLPAEHRHALLAFLRIPLTLISCFGMLFLHSHSTDWQIVVMGCILLSLCTLSSLLLHLAVGRTDRSKIDDHFVLQLTTEVPDDLDESSDVPESLVIN
ncbi:unnamed protein product [Enterobius vermicularis]|uniref:Molybdate-anion transporter n=1 Tax=Enterobius vermicularis TaxID=51028 RepID=A0A0N4VB77_ENTVE|nr:unnamed protein product [Enterobius vermicularis]